jgi:hypothetical protein
MSIKDWIFRKGVIMGKINLSGSWGFCLDGEKAGIRKEFYREVLQDTIVLPATVSTAKKGKDTQEIPEELIKTGSLTDPYYFEGYTWYSKTVEIEELRDREFFLVLERTRISHVWIGEEYVGSNHSLCTSHRYRITPCVKKQMKITVMVDNTSYPVNGGHMTSADTQTNWNGITGELYIEELNSIFLSNVGIYPDAAESIIKVKALLNGAESIRVRAEVNFKENSVSVVDYDFYAGENLFSLDLNGIAYNWSEHTPDLYQLKLSLLCGGEGGKVLPEAEYSCTFGLRDFKAAGHYFEINGIQTFLRGKHDGLIFPLTGHPTMEVEGWLKVLGTAKEYGINHYRFHTCCPPEACFLAADQLGIYLEPELPFWGTVTEEGEVNHDKAAQQYLIDEGFRILDEFGNHPSFVMMSMGNELWGSKNVLDSILMKYKSYDNRHLYTQGSNNFQFMPVILEQEDFYCGVRFSRERLFRGSYAMCDAPLGHIQTAVPGSVYNYDNMIRPEKVLAEKGEDSEVTIQYGTGVKTVKMEEAEEMIPEIPVVSHEIGQYAMYPDFSEIDKYTGVLKAENFKIFRERLKEKGMLQLADEFFKASGRFAADCYKAEIETALRSRELAGFQLLDLQDFSGQGTALVGILNAFMENKGVITAEEWRQFCSDAVILAELPGFVYTAGEELSAGIKLALYRQSAMKSPTVVLSLLNGEEVLLTEEIILEDNYTNGVHQLCDMVITLPEFEIPQKLALKVSLNEKLKNRINDSSKISSDDILDKVSDKVAEKVVENVLEKVAENYSKNYSKNRLENYSENCSAYGEIENNYELWVYPDKNLSTANKDIIITKSLEEALDNLNRGRRVILYPENLNEKNSIEGTYCTDFWCYPMFRSISESMGKAVPVGTHGLYIKKNHKLFKHFPTAAYTTPQWYELIEDSRCCILKDSQLEPIVWTIDNFERNHKLGNLFEVRVGEGRLLVCTFNLEKKKEHLNVKWFEYCLTEYAGSNDFEPEFAVDPEELKRIGS